MLGQTGRTQDLIGETSLTVTIKPRIIAITLCWVTGFGLAVASFLTAHHLSALANGFLMVAGVMTVRCRVDRQADAWMTAYEAGREVTKLRRVR